MNFYKKIIVFIIMILIFFAVFSYFRSLKNETARPQPNTPISQNESPRIVSTKPDPLNGTVVSTTEVIELTFNQSLQNAPEFKIRIDPEVEYKIELSSDRKVARIIFQKPLELGTPYTLFILPDSKFDGGGKLDGEKKYHFQTIKYQGV